MKEDKVRKERESLVVVANNFIQRSCYELTANQQKVIAYAISKITPQDIEIPWVVFNISEYCKVCGIDRNHFYNDFRQLVDNLDSKSFWVETDTEVFKFRWFSEVKIDKRDSTIKILLNSNLKEYLIDLTKNFTQYNLYNILPLKSKYSVRLYQLFKSYSFKQNIEISIEELRHKLCLNLYPQYKDFRKRVLDVAVREINEFTDIKVSYEPIKKGKRIVAIDIHIKAKSTIDSFVAYKTTYNKLDIKS